MNIIVVDWDDTCLPSTWLHGRSATTTCSSTYQRQIIQLFRVARQLADQVVIITNAEQGWVERSSERHLPKVREYLIRHNIKIISARSQYEKYVNTTFGHCSNNSMLWKQFAFTSLIDQAPENTYQIFSIGDGHDERAAVFSLESLAQVAASKSIKLIDSPTLDLLSVQIQQIIENLPALFNQRCRLDLMMTNTSLDEKEACCP